MPTPDDVPARWGRTTVLWLDRDADGNPDLPEWSDLVLPGADGTIHHGHRSGSTLPDTVAVHVDDRPVALADAFAYLLDNQYCWDREYYLVLRVREILEPAGWRRLPWAHLGPGDVFVAWDKFHHLPYSREPGGDAEVMSYGGDWNDLQMLVDADHPVPGRRAALTDVSDATVLRAVRDKDVALVRALLDAGGDPDAGWSAPPAALRAVSVDRDSYALLEAAQTGPVELVGVLLTAGASVDGPPDASWTPLQAVLSRGPSEQTAEIVRSLLRRGADPDAGQRPDHTPRALALRSSPEIAALFPVADSGT